MKRSGSMGPTSRLSGTAAMRVRSIGGDASNRSSSLSGRPSSLSGRSSSFGIGSCISDFRPLSSGGSAHRPRSAIPRAVVQSSSRGSIAPGRGAASATEYAKDLRPLNDKNYRERCVNELLEFLAEKGFQSLVSRKSLTNPNTADFIKVFELLVGCIIPNYKIKPKNKLEDEIPKLLKDLGYPYNIPRSYMSTIGAQHTWPTILGALIWLKKVIELSGRCNVASIMFPHVAEDRGNQPQNRILFDFIMDSYNHFMKGNDTFEEQTDALKKNLVNNLGLADIDKDIQDIERDIARNQHILDDLENQPNDLANYQDQRAALNVDVTKMTRYTTHLQQHVAEQKQTAKQLEDEEKAILAELAARERELKEKEEQIAQQGARGVNVHELGLQHKTLRRKLARREQYLREVDSEIHKTEISLMEQKENVEKVLNEYKKVTPSLMSVASDAYMELTGEISKNEITRVKNAQMTLQNVIKQCKQRADALEHSHRVVCAEMEQLRDSVNDYDQQLKELKMKDATLNQELMQKKEVHQQMIEELQREIESKKAAKTNLAAPVSIYRNIEEATQALEQMKAKLAAQKLKNKEDLRRKREAISNSQTEILKQRNAMEEKLEDRTRELRQKMSSRLEEMLRESEEIERLYQEIVNPTDDNE